MTAYSTKEQLLKSNQFRRLVHEGFIEIVDAKVAHETLDTEDARMELELIKQKSRITDSLSGTPEVVVTNSDLQDPALKRAKERASEQSNASSIEATTPDPVVEQLVIQLLNGDVTEPMAHSTLRTMIADLTKADFDHILNHIRKVKYPRVYHMIIEEATKRGYSRIVDNANEANQK